MIGLVCSVSDPFYFGPYDELIVNLGVLFIVIASGCLFVGAQVMFEYRAGERRRGLNLKC